MKAYKVFDPSWSCRGYSFQKKGSTPVGMTYTHEGKLILCERGFHFCRNLSQCFNYYSFDPQNKVAEIEVLGDVLGDPNDKECTNKFQILREISWEEVLRLVNTGVANSGNRNSGNRNSGNLNSGDWNSGDWNSGNRNSGNWNSGNLNSGDSNSGNRNSGNWNSGNWNSGNRNSGDLNSGDPDKFRVFNSWITSEEYYKIIRPDFFWFNLSTWVSFDTASEEERTQHKQDIETCGGFLKNLSYKEAFQMSWNKADKEDKLRLFDIPGFDSDIFFEISGIRTSRKEVEKL